MILKENIMIEKPHFLKCVYLTLTLSILQGCGFYNKAFVRGYTARRLFPGVFFTLQKLNWLEV